MAVRWQSVNCVAMVPVALLNEVVGRQGEVVYQSREIARGSGTVENTIQEPWGEAIASHRPIDRDRDRMNI